MKSFTLQILVATVLAVLFVGCDKKKTQSEEEKGSITVTVKNVVGDQALQLNGSTTVQPYLNTLGQPFGVTMYKYYLSNVVLVKGDGTEYKVPESHYLIDESDDASKTFTISDVPAGTYTSIKLLQGVDEARNTSGAQTGALDVMHGMFWDWNTGYIMAKLEGYTTSSNSGLLSIHLGGFTGKNNVLQNVSLSLPSNIEISKNSNTKVALQSDVLKWFETPYPTDFSITNAIMANGIPSSEISQNYAHMLKITSVEN